MAFGAIATTRLRSAPGLPPRPRPARHRRARARGRSLPMAAAPATASAAPRPTAAVGPDLTHVGVAPTIGAGTLPQHRRHPRPLHRRSRRGQAGGEDAGLRHADRRRHRAASPPGSRGSDDARRRTEAERQAQESSCATPGRRPTGWRYWTGVNNTQVGLWYAATAFFFMLFAGVLALIVRGQLAVPGQRPRLRRSLQPGLHAARHGDDVPVRRADLRGRGDLPAAGDARRARTAVPAASALRLLELPDRRRLRLRLDLLRRGAVVGLVHVSAARDRRGVLRHRRRHLAARPLLHRGGLDRRRGRDHRRHHEVPRRPACAST